MVQTSQAGAPTVAEMPPIENRTRAGTPAATKTTCFQSTSRNMVGLVEAATAIFPPALCGSSWPVESLAGWSRSWVTALGGGPYKIDGSRGGWDIYAEYMS